MLFIKLLALAGSWLLFYKILKSKNKSLPGTKATVITLLFAALIFRLATDAYAILDRAFFVFNDAGTVPLNASPLKIPLNQDVSYCNQFTDQNNKPIQRVSERSDGRYCGVFWKFEKDNNLMIPYKITNSNQIIYWASPSLRIIRSNTNVRER